jgi:hypothetical protein
LVHEFVQHLWDVRNGFPNLSIITLDSAFKKFVRRAVDEGVDPKAVEDAFYDVDRTLTFDEMVKAVEKATGLGYKSPEEEMEEYTRSELDRMATELDSRVLTEEDYERLLGYEQDAKRLREQLKRLKEERERVEREKAEREAEYQRRLSEAERRAREMEERRVKMVTVKILRDMPSFVGIDFKTYGPFKAGETVSLPEGNAAVLIEKGVAESWAVPLPVAPPMPRPVKGLSRDEIAKLEDVWRDAFFRELGRVPPNAMSTFRVELEKVKDKSYAEAEEHLLMVVRELVAAFAVKESMERVGAPRRIEVYHPPREEEEMFVIGRVPHAEPPKEPLEPEEMAFPRGPSSGEQERLWMAFRYRLQEQGFNPFEYQKEFDEYISNTQFKSWDDLLKKYERFVEAVKKGEELPPLWQWKGMPIPAGLEGVLRKEPAERSEDIITHFSSVVIRNARGKGELPTVRELIDLLAERFDPAWVASLTKEDIALALHRAYERKDPWLTNISLEELEEFIQTYALPRKEGEEET